MDKKELIDDLEEILESFRKYATDPKYSNKAGDVYMLFKRLNDALEKV